VQAPALHRISAWINLGVRRLAAALRLKLVASAVRPLNLATTIFAGLPSTCAGRSMLRPYGIVVRQDASRGRKREQAPALHRISAWINFEASGRENQKSRRGRRRYEKRLQDAGLKPGATKTAATLSLECGGLPPL
jgi:hypothetical protein